MTVHISIIHKKAFAAGLCPDPLGPPESLAVTGGKGRWKREETKRGKV